MDTQAFYHHVYQIIAQIPFGKVISYGDIAILLGKPRHSRLVGRALKQIPPELPIPSHRVVNSQGRLVPGWYEQKALLLAEGITLKANGEVDMGLFRWNWRSIT